MLKRLHLLLTILYPLAAFALMVTLGGSAFLLVRFYLYDEIEEVMALKLAREYQLYTELPPKDMPESLRQILTIRPDIGNPDSQLSSIFLLKLNISGQAVSPYTEGSLPPPVLDGLEEAQKKGLDYRTVRLTDGEGLRVMTLYLPQPHGEVAFLQASRTLNDIDLIFNRVALVVLGAGALAGLGVGLFSNKLASISLHPTHQAWEQQQRFVANASHELRTPVTLIRASAEFACREDTPPAMQEELMKDICEECDHLTRLVDDLLSLSRLDAGHLPLSIQSLSAEELCQEIYRQFLPLTNEQQVSLQIFSAHEYLMADLTRLRQVLHILVDNALGYTPPGGSIILQASRQGKQILLEVIDNGTGIPAEHIPHLFERFYQADAPPYRERKGSGLGLSLAAAMIQAQHGTLEVESQPGFGTRMMVRLPASSAAQKEPF